jgi:hypothetical protein
VRDYLVDKKYGLGEDHTLIDTTALTAAADLCDEDVALNGGGTHTRYECNGVMNTDNQIKANIEQILAAMGGRLTYSGGKYFIDAAGYVAPTFEFTEAHCVSDIQTQTKQSRRGVYNGVKGIFVSEEKNYKVLDYPAQISSTYEAEDGDPIYLDMPLPFVTNNTQAQRLAKIALLKSRQQVVVTMTVNLKGLQVKVGDTIKLTNERLGYDEKIFEVIDYSLAITAGGNLAVNLQLIETAAAIYDWATSDEQDFLSGGVLDLYDGRTVDNVTSLAKSEIGLLGPDGSVSTTVELTWTAPDDAFIDFYKIRYNKNGTTEYFHAETKEPRILLSGLEVGVAYDFRVQVQNLLGVTSSGTTLSSQQLDGDTTAPAVPTSPSATGGIQTITCEWNNPTDEDYAFTEIHVVDTDTTPAGGAAPTAKVAGEEYVVTGLAASVTKHFFLRAVDFSGNKSAYTDGVSGTSVQAQSADVDIEWADVAGTTNAPEDNATENTGALADLDQVDTAQIADNAVTSTQADTDSLDTALGSEFPTNGLSHYWPCNSVQGDILIDVVGGVNATQRTAGGATISTDSPSGKSFTNGASNGFALLNDTQADAIQTSNGFAWSIWFKSETTSGDGAGRIITRDFSDNWGVQVKQDEGPNQTVRFFGEPDDEIVSTTVAQGEWHHICVVEDGSGDIFGYLNGEKVTSAITYTPTTEPRPVVVGCNTESGATGSNAFTGKLTEIRAYNRALTDTEVRALYRVPSASIPQELDGELIVDGTIVADKIQASSITVDKLSGDVSELFPSSYEQRLTLTNTNQETTVFTLPAPQLSISKRVKVDQTFEYTFQNSDTSAQTYIVFFAMQMKSKGGTGVQVGASGGVYHVSYPFQYNQLVYLVGNHLADLDTSGKVGRDSSGAGLGQINGVYYDGYLNRTYVLVSQISVVFSTGDTMFFSPTGFTSAGTYYSPSSIDVIRVHVPANTTVSYRHHVNQTFGPTTTATDFRGQMRTSLSYSNTTITLKKWFGTLELIA